MAIAIQTNSDRQSNVREIFNGFRFNEDVTERVAVLNDPQSYSLSDLNFYRGLYTDFREKPNKKFPKGVIGEIEELTAERNALKERGRAMDYEKTKRLIQLIGNLQRLELMLGVLENAIAERKLAIAQKRLQEAQRKTQPQAPIGKWERDVAINKAEAASRLGGEDILKRKLKHAKDNGKTVIQMLSNVQRLSFEPCGATIRYILEKRVD